MKHTEDHCLYNFFYKIFKRFRSSRSQQESLHSVQILNSGQFHHNQYLHPISCRTFLTQNDIVSYRVSQRKQGTSNVGHPQFKAR